MDADSSLAEVEVLVDAASDALVELASDADVLLAIDSLVDAELLM